jgi:hypothetical protein
MIVNEERDLSGQCRRLHELMLAHLREADAPPWPGTDSLTLDEVVHSYPQAAASGLVPDLQTLLADHPDLADVLREFFAV